MENVFSSASFITTSFTNYFDIFGTPWGQKRPRLYQHTDLIPWKGLPIFVKDFDCDDEGDAVIYFTSLGCVDIYVNGRRLDCGEMKPGWTSYDKRALYMSDTVRLAKGRNRVLAVVSAGWYTGRIAGGYYGNGTPSCMIAINKNGKTVVSTDESWKCAVGGQILSADIWDGEYRDGRQDGYDEMSLPSYGVSEWKNAVKYDYKGEVTPLIGPAVKVRDGLGMKPQNISVSDGVTFDGTYFGKLHFRENVTLPYTLKTGCRMTVDMGQETVGWLKIKVKAARGTEIKMRYAEFLNDSGSADRGSDGPEGSVYTINLRSALGKAYYVTNGDGIEEYKPTFTFFGYRYVEISAGSDVEFVDISAEVVGSDTTETGRIETSDENVNKLFSNALRGQRSNYFSVPTDCPQRDERLGWTGDAQAFSVTAAYNADVYGFFRKWMQDMRDSQSESGGYADVNPRVGCCYGEDACAWGDAGVIIPYNLYRIYGDDTMIKEHFDSMDAYLTGLVKKYGMTGPIPRYGDWLAYDKCDNKFISSAYFVHDIDLMIYMCEVAGRSDRSEYYKSLREEAYGYFRTNFLDPDGLPIENTQCNKIIVLAFGLLEKDKEEKVSSMLAEQIKANGSRLSCGFLGTYNLCPTLSKFGKDGTAYDLLLQRNEPSWLYSVDQGATTIWERWNSYTKANGFGDVGMNSFNHYAYGAIVEWMYRYMAGIDVIEPGFGTFSLCPRIDLRRAEDLPEGQKNVKWVKASFRSPKGVIKSEWNTENGLVYRCSVPEGTTARLVLPALARFITVNGVKHEIKGDTFEMTLSSGEYTLIQ